VFIGHPKIRPDPDRVRFVGFGSYSLDLEVFAYLCTSDYNEYLAIREDVYLRMMELVLKSRTGFAFPAKFNKSWR
jgi:MscS family membrane protein